MPGFKTLGKLFFSKKLQAESPLHVPAVARVYSAANRQDNNPAQIEAGERTSRRGRS